MTRTRRYLPYLIATTLLVACKSKEEKMDGEVEQAAPASLRETAEEEPAQEPPGGAGAGRLERSDGATGGEPASCPDDACRRACAVVEEETPGDCASAWVQNCFTDAPVEGADCHGFSASDLPPESEPGTGQDDKASDDDTIGGVRDRERRKKPPRKSVRTKAEEKEEESRSSGSMDQLELAPNDADDSEKPRGEKSGAGEKEEFFGDPAKDDQAPKL